MLSIIGFFYGGKFHQIWMLKKKIHNIPHFVEENHQISQKKKRKGIFIF
jgi:hypothetical protein